MAFRAGKIQQEIFGAFLVSPPKNQTLGVLAYNLRRYVALSLE